ncbi:MAG: ABC-F family ATP-binding cassette domain-containing protein [Subdoligranulum sp.]|nr:ABC-F family ATP-binding cassette domain-containing protein [Subdoligranulum sp.]
MLVQLKNLTKSFGSQTVLDKINLTVNEKDRLGIVGVNGAGKTTLFNIIAGALEAEAYENATDAVYVRKGLKIGYLRQVEAVESQNTLYGEIRRSFAEIDRIAAQLEALTEKISCAKPDSAEYAGLAEKFDKLSSYYQSIGGYDTEFKIRRVLNGMGFSDKSPDMKAGELSGGEKTRFALAKLLCEEPDLLLLDEPTNHLDFETRAWLEEYLSSFKGAILAVSHDRFFLDKIADGICELDNGKLKRYKGNYTEFYAQKKEETKSALKEYEKQRAQLAKMEEFVRKNLAASASVNSVGSRVKALEKAERLERPLEEPRDVRFEFGFDAQPVKEALSVKNLSVSVGGKKLFENVDLTLFRGEKLAIVGANGVGKTSFIKALTGEIPFSGRVNWGAGVKTGYFEQECRNLVLSNTVYDEVCRHFSLLTPYDVRSLLARALIFGDDVEKRVGELSGANRSKVALAILMRKRPNVLVMDEPTNHLDYKAMEGLDKALSDFDGTLLLVSHDRFLLNRVPTRLAELTPDGFRFFSSLDAYTAKAAQKAVVFEKQRSARSESSYKADKKQGRVLRAEKNRLERELTAKEKEAEALAALLSSPQAMSDYKFYNETAKKFQEVQTECDALLEKWMLCEGD